MVAALVAAQRPPVEFEEYRLLRVLGEGETGQVWAALDTRLDRQVAIKFLRGEVMDGRRRERFVTEARAVARLRHPGVVGIHRAGEIDGRPYLVSELVEGQSLTEVARPVPFARLLGWALCLADALRAAHGQQVLHRDIKPANLMLTPAGELKLLDFGLAKLGDAAAREPALEAGGPADPRPGVTRTGALLGTPRYLAPELWDGGEASAGSDLYALGVVLYELATGDPPFAAVSLDELHRSVCGGEAPPLGPGYPVAGDGPDPGAAGRAFAAVIERCLRRDPGERFESAAALHAALLPIASPLPVDEPPGRPARGGGRARPLVAAGLVALVLVGAGAGAWLRGRLVGRREPAVTAAPATRRAVALVGFRDRAAASSDAWIGPALVEALGAELAIGGAIKVAGREEVGNMQVDLAPSLAGEGRDLSPATVERVRRYLGVDAILTGSYWLTGVAGERTLHLAWRLLGSGAAEGEAESPAREQFALVARAGGPIRHALGAGPAPAAELDAVRAALPVDPETQRLLTEGTLLVDREEMLAARDLLLQAAERDPSNPIVHRELTRVAERVGPPSWVRDEARRAFELSRGLPRAAQLRSEAAYHAALQRFDEAAELYRALLRFYPDSVPDGLRLAQLLHVGGRVDEAMEVLARLRQLPAPLGDDPRIDLAGEFYLRMAGRMAESLPLSRRAAAAGRARGNRFVLGRARMVEGFALLAMGRLAEAEPALVEAAPLLHAVGGHNGALWAEDGLARVRLRRGEVRAATVACQETLERNRALQDPTMEIFLLGSCSSALRAGGRLGDARAMADRALALCRAGAGMGCLLPASTAVAATRLQAGEVQAALGVLAEASAGDAGRPPSADRARLDLLRGEAQLLAGDLAAARARLDEVIRFADAGALGRVADPARLRLAEVALATGHPEEAEALTRAVIARLVAEGAVDEELEARALLAEAVGRRDPRQALAELSAMEERARRSEGVASRAAALTTLARLRAGAGSGVSAAELARSRGDLGALVSLTAGAGLEPLACAARLALADLDEASGQPRAARAVRRAVERAAADRGMGLLSRRASAARR